MAFHGKVALLTGGASGMGQVFARRLAKEGAKVAVLDLNETGMKETAEGLSGIHCYKCNVSDLAQVKEVVKTVENELGQIDRVVHAAAIMPTCPVAKADPEVVSRLMRVNYEGTVNIIATTLPAMLERNAGDMIIFGSIAGSVLAPHFGPYSATKAAVNAYVETLIHENLGTSVRLMLVKPPLVNTPLINQATGTSNPRTVQQGVAAKRFAKPEDIIEAIEKGIEKNIKILLPDGEAKFLTRLRRFAPRLLWRIVLKSEAS